MIRAACVQLNASDDVAANVRHASSLIREARGQGARFIATPENTNLMAADKAAKLEHAFVEADDPALPAFRALAEELGIWLLIGSLAIKVSAGKTANRSFLISPEGAIAARYDKIHLYDVDLANGERYRESRSVQGGATAVTADLPFGRIGLTVCYDLRFPQLYRALAYNGAILFTVPAAFTELTGKAHWHVLLRARAIENGAFVLAPAQCGTHPGGRRTYGHSLIVSPWGEILAEGGEAPGVIVADIDPARSVAARAQIPSLCHDRTFRLGDRADLAEASVSADNLEKG
jgi:deaminated glutathione amidase